MKVEVAVLLPAVEPFTAPENIRERSGKEVKWADRPRVTLEVAPDTRLGGILDRAAEHFDITLLPSHADGGARPVSDAIVGFAFYRDAAGEGTSDISGKWAILDEDGLVRCPCGVCAHGDDGLCGHGGADRVFLSARVRGY